MSTLVFSLRCLLSERLGELSTGHAIRLRHRLPAAVSDQRVLVHLVQRVLVMGVCQAVAVSLAVSLNLGSLELVLLRVQVLGMPEALAHTTPDASYRVVLQKGLGLGVINSVRGTRAVPALL